jgi:hypothetical protein
VTWHILDRNNILPFPDVDIQDQKMTTAYTRPRMLVALLMIAVSAPVMAGCGGGGARSETQIRNTTVSKGQALIDLKRAYDAGAISKSEYENQRQQILKE